MAHRPLAGAYLCGVVFGIPVIVVALKVFVWAIPALHSCLEVLL